MKRNIKAIVFDFDGVVIDSEPLYEKAERKLFEEYNIHVPDEDWKHLKGISEEEFFEHVRKKYGASAPLQELRKRVRELLLNEFSHGLKYMDGFREFMSEICVKHKVGLVTSTSWSVIKWIFENTTIENHFEYIVTAEDVNMRKPHPEPYLEVFKKMGVAPDEVIVIEDSIHGVNSAVAAGATTIGFTSSLSEEDLSAAHYFADSFFDIKKILQSMDSHDDKKSTE